MKIIIETRENSKKISISEVESILPTNDYVYSAGSENRNYDIIILLLFTLVLKWVLIILSFRNHYDAIMRWFVNVYVLQ